MSYRVLPSSMAYGTTASKEMASLIAGIRLQQPALAGGMQMEARHGQSPCIPLPGACLRQVLETEDGHSLSKKPFVRLGSHIYKLDVF